MLDPIEDPKNPGKAKGYKVYRDGEYLGTVLRRGTVWIAIRDGKRLCDGTTRKVAIEILEEAK